VPAIDDMPASLSHVIITDTLRNELAFNGVIITDALNMNALTNNYSSAEIAVLAVKAGNDILLAPLNPESCINAIISAVENGELTEDRINESVLRILTLKFEKLY